LLVPALQEQVAILVRNDDRRPSQQNDIAGIEFRKAAGRGRLPVSEGGKSGSMAKMRLKPGATELQEALQDSLAYPPRDEYRCAAYDVQGLVTLDYGNGSNTTIGW